MDDLESELRVPGELGENESSDDESIKRKRTKKPHLPLEQTIFKETPRETGFHKTTRNCLQHIKAALLHHRWKEGAEYMSSYSRTLEDSCEHATTLRRYIYVDHLEDKHRYYTTIPTRSWKTTTVYMSE